ncbi:hypothetical protein INR49_018489 [Caranx melampygus]|nr:hypothetical protein INR49_018489 [Caranx melampygus]
MFAPHSRKVEISIPTLPRLGASESIHCEFGSIIRVAEVTGRTRHWSPVSCQTPGRSRPPPTSRGNTFAIGTELMKHTEEEVLQEQRSKFKFTGHKSKPSLLSLSFFLLSTATFAYDKQQEVNVSFHIKDRDTERKIDSTLTAGPVSHPEITDIIPRFGPLNGRISVTIKGSNMGIKKEDIKKITVAGVDCVHQQDRYSVSTR